MKKTIIAAIMAVMCVALFAQNAESDFVIDANGVITRYNGWSTTVVIPETVNGVRVTAIGEKAFSGNDLTSVTISGNNIIIGGNAFANNPITSITLGRNHVFNAYIVSNINYNNSSLFYDYVCNDRKAGTYTANRAVAAIKTEANFNYIETQYGAFITGYTGSSGNRLKIPSRLGGLAVKAIGGGLYGMSEFKNISRVRIPDSVTYIGDSAFDGFVLTGNRLAEITIPNSVTHIGNEAFRGNQLTSVTIPNSVTHIGTQAFSSNPLTSVTIGSNVTIGRNTFPTGFDFGFDSVYNANGKAAGTYTRPNANSSAWAKQ